MALSETLDRIREASSGRIPPEIRAVMECSIADLRVSGIMQRVVRVGQPAPDFTLPNTTRASVSLFDLALPEIAAVGASLVVVSPQVARTPRETEEPKALPFEVLRDFGNWVAEAYGLVFTAPEDLQAIYAKLGIDLAAGNGTWRLPIPARFVIDRAGIVRAVDADPDYTRRPEPAQTIEALRGLRGQDRERGPHDDRAEGLDPAIRTREIVFEADVSLVTPFLKLATVSRGGQGHHTFASDEGPSLGGLGSAPTPLVYFSAALAF